jgi:hypothetical protein
LAKARCRSPSPRASKYFPRLQRSTCQVSFLYFHDSGLATTAAQSNGPAGVSGLGAETLSGDPAISLSVVAHQDDSESTPQIIPSGVVVEYEFQGSLWLFAKPGWPVALSGEGATTPPSRAPTYSIRRRTFTWPLLFSTILLHVIRRVWKLPSPRNSRKR